MEDFSPFLFAEPVTPMGQATVHFAFRIPEGWQYQTIEVLPVTTEPGMPCLRFWPVRLHVAQMPGTPGGLIEVNHTIDIGAGMPGLVAACDAAIMEGSSIKGKGIVILKPEM